MDTGALQLGLELEDLIHLDFKQMCKAAKKEMEVLRKCVPVLVAHAHYRWLLQDQVWEDVDPGEAA